MTIIAIPDIVPFYRRACALLWVLVLLKLLTLVVALSANIDCRKEPIYLAGDNGGRILTEALQSIQVGEKRECRLVANHIQLKI